MLKRKHGVSDVTGETIGGEMSFEVWVLNYNPKYQHVSHQGMTQI